MGWYSAQNGILRIMTTYNDPLMKVTMTVMEMLASVTVVCHLNLNLTMMMTIGIIEKKLMAS